MFKGIYSLASMRSSRSPWHEAELALNTWFYNGFDDHFLAATGSIGDVLAPPHKGVENDPRVNDGYSFISYSSC